MDEKSMKSITLFGVQLAILEIMDSAIECAPFLAKDLPKYEVGIQYLEIDPNTCYFTCGIVFGDRYSNQEQERHQISGYIMKDVTNATMVEWAKGFFQFHDQPVSHWYKCLRELNKKFITRLATDEEIDEDMKAINLSRAWRQMKT